MAGRVEAAAPVHPQQRIRPDIAWCEHCGYELIPHWALCSKCHAPNPTFVNPVAKTEAQT